MNYFETENLKFKLNDYVEKITIKSKGQNMYACPLCSSGTGKNHTGAFSINSKDSTHWKCFSCGKSGDIFDLIGEIENISKPVDQLKRAYELYGTNISQIHKTHSKIKSTIEKKRKFNLIL